MTLTEKLAKQIGENLQRARKARGYTRDQVADVAGVAKTVIGRYETGMILPPLDRLFVIAEYLKVPVATLTGENELTDKIVNDAIFEYRLQQAYSRIEFFLSHPRNDEKHFDADGNILIFVPNGMKYEGGKLIYKVDKDGNAGDEIALSAKEFVNAVEFAEKFALQTQVTFCAAFRTVLLLDRK